MICLPFIRGGPDRFMGIQAMVNIGGITRALPMTGITLPFVSHGGFSLITSFAMLGMLMAFSHRNAQDARAVARIKRESDGPDAPAAVQCAPLHPITTSTLRPLPSAALVRSVL